MDFPKKELLEKYLRIRKELIEPFKPSFTVEGGTVRYVQFNDATEELNMFSKFVIARLLNRKFLFPKRTSAKIAANADPANYVTLQYDNTGVLRVAQCGEYNDDAYASVYVSPIFATASAVPAASSVRLSSIREYVKKTYATYDPTAKTTASRTRIGIHHQRNLFFPVFCSVFVSFSAMIIVSFPRKCPYSITKPSTSVNSTRHFFKHDRFR